MTVSVYPPFLFSQLFANFSTFLVKVALSKIFLNKYLLMLFSQHVQPCREGSIHICRRSHISQRMKKSIEVRFYKCKTIMKKLYIQNVCGRSHLSQRKTEERLLSTITPSAVTPGKYSYIYIQIFLYN